MITSEKNRFGQQLHILYPGDYFASRNGGVIGTVAGISVVVCLYDPGKMIGGMGHFIVPGAIGTEGIIADDIAKEGIANMEYLMGEIVKLGGDRKYLRAKIFGAGHTSNGDARAAGIVRGSMRFLREYFNLEGIGVEKEELGGNYRRKLFFFPKNGAVYRKLLMNNGESSEFVRLEMEYIERVFRNRDKYGDVILF